jgi:predicted RNA binding protein YcfA (HicA-like mRNA interferase family)
MLAIVQSGTSDGSVSVDEICHLLKNLGFEERIRGDHHIFSRYDVEEIVNLQPRGHLAKAYQVKQVRDLTLRYKLGDPND